MRSVALPRNGAVLECIAIGGTHDVAKTNAGHHVVPTVAPCHSMLNGTITTWLMMQVPQCLTQGSFALSLHGVQANDPVSRRGSRTFRITKDPRT